MVLEKVLIIEKMFYNRKGNEMNYAILSHKINPDNVKELLKNNGSHQDKKRIWDDPGEVERMRNKLKRQRTNEIFNDEYFDKFHSKK